MWSKRSFAGGLIGALSFRGFGYDALYLPAALTGITGVFYAMYRHLHPPAPLSD